MTSKLSVFFAASLVWSTAALATPNDVSESVSSKVSTSLGRELSTSEAAAIEARVNEFAEAINQPRFDKTAATTAEAPVRDYFLCVGGKAAFGLGGRQGLKCVNVFNMKSVTVTFNGESGSSLATGLSANQYVGVNGGVAADLGFMIVDHPKSVSVDGGYGFSSQSNHLTGGMVSYTLGMSGVLGGLFFKNDSVVFIGAWQPGVIAFEGGFSDIRIATEN